MTKIIWIVFLLFVTGNSFFVLPFHFSSDSITNNHIINYKKDSALLHIIFVDSSIPLKLNMPASYNALYYKKDSPVIPGNHPYLIVNVSFLDDLDFFSSVFPFYKSVNCMGNISFYSVIKIGDQPGRDSTALIGNIKISVSLSVKGICPPLYVRNLVDKEFVTVLKQEMNKIEDDIYRPVITDTIVVEKPVRRIRPGKRTKGLV